MRWTRLWSRTEIQYVSCDNKVVRNLEQDKIAATYSMNMGIDELLKFTI
jgi:hypothetical protein